MWNGRGFAEHQSRRSWSVNENARKDCNECPWLVNIDMYTCKF